MNPTAVEQLFPTYVDAPIKDITSISNGVETSFKITTNANTYFMKFNTSGYFNSKGFICGVKLLPRLAEQGIPVAEAIGGSISHPPFGDFYITTYLDNCTVLTGYDRPIQSYQRYFKQLGKYTSLLHSIPTDSNTYGWAGWFNNSIRPFGGTEIYTDWIVKMIYDSLESISEDHTFFEYKSYILEIVDEIEDVSITFGDPVISNYDLKFENCLINPRKENPHIEAIIDWDNPILAPPIHTLVKLERHYTTIGSVALEDPPEVTKAIDYIIEEYLSHTSFSYIEDEDVMTDIRTDVCRFEDCVGMIRHFENYYGNFSTKDREWIKEYYVDRLEMLGERIRSYN